MDDLETDQTTMGELWPVEELVDVLTTRRRITPTRRAAHELQCVSSGYLSHGCSCEASIPAEVVLAAWSRELACGSREGDRLFRLAWRGEVWVAYGLADGSVRGIYCPEHSAERDERSFMQRIGQHSSRRAISAT